MGQTPKHRKENEQDRNQRTVLHVALRAPKGESIVLDGQDVVPQVHTFLDKIGGLKVIAESGRFAARPSGTEDIYKIYAESFQGADHLHRILEEAQTIVSAALSAGTQQEKSQAKTKVTATS